MVFNPGKRNHLHTSIKKHPLTSQYSLHGHLIKCILSIKYLGVIINSSLTWSDYVTYIAQKANLLAKKSKTLSSISQDESYVYSILEYCSIVWAPHASQDN